MSRRRPDYHDIAHLPLTERVAHVRDRFLQDRLDGVRHPVEDYVRDVPEAERARFLDELHAAESFLDENATTGFGPSGQEARSVPGLLGRYQIQRLLGRGGFGEVWQAFDPELQRPVAVKVLRRDVQWPDDQVALFLEEGRKLARLKHPGIVAVYDVGQAGTGLFIVSELIEGGTLEQRITEGKVARRDIPALLADVADAAHHAHLHGLVHRDIKPANILLDAKHRPHLVDFGVALAEEEQRGARGSVAGTVAYMSPEQVRGDSHLLDGRTDVYSLGVVLYELLTGRRPFQGKTRDELREQILLRPPRPLRAIDDTIPPELEAICLKCLAKSAPDRYATADDLATALRRVVAEPEVPTPDPPDASRRRGVWLAAGALLLAACLALAASGRLWPGRPPPPDAGKPPEPPVVAIDPHALRVKERVWPGSRPGDPSTWQIPKATGSLSVNASSYALLELADLRRDDFDVSVQIRQTNADGRIGVFFGLREDPKRGKATYQLLRLEARDKAHRLLRIVGGYPLDSPLAQDGPSTIGAAPVAFSDGRFYPLAFRVRGGKLVEVTFDGKPVAGLTDAGAASHDCRGAFGVYVFKGTGDFARVVLDDDLKQFVDDRVR